MLIMNLLRSVNANLSVCFRVEFPLEKKKSKLSLRGNCLEKSAPLL